METRRGSVSSRTGKPTALERRSKGLWPPETIEAVRSLEGARGGISAALGRGGLLRQTSRRALSSIVTPRHRWRVTCDGIAAERHDGTEERGHRLEGPDPRRG